MSTQRKEYSLQDDIRFLVNVKGMTVKDALAEMEQTLRGTIPEEVKDQMYTEALFGNWGGNNK